MWYSSTDDLMIPEVPDVVQFYRRSNDTRGAGCGTVRLTYSYVMQ